MNLKDLYSQIITENSRNSAHRHEVEGATHTLEGVNPSCGDDIILSLRVEDGVVADGGFTGSGCAISQASASLMLDLVIGKTKDQARRLADIFLRMIKGEVTEEEKQELQEASVLQDVSHMPARVKCAVLAWHTLDDALKEKK